MNVVSLLPSATEILFALDLEPVGISHVCDYPPETTTIPRIYESNITTAETSERVNEQVADAERNSAKIYEVNRDTLHSVNPDLIITQDVCEVCAIETVHVKRILDEEGINSDVLTIDVHSLEDLFDAIQAIGNATDTNKRAKVLLEELQSQTETIIQQAQQATTTPKVIVLDWMNPPMTAGHWIPEMIELLGGEYGLKPCDGRSHQREWATILEYDPDVLVVAPCGFELQHTLNHIDEVTERQGWNGLSAVVEQRAYAMEGHHLVNRPGPRLVETFEYLGGLVHPNCFPNPPNNVARSIPSKAVER